VLPGTGCSSLPETIELSRCAVVHGAVGILRGRFGDRLAGVKDSSGEVDQSLGYLRAAPGLTLLFGSDAGVAEAFRGGAHGVISALANVIPPRGRGGAARRRERGVGRAGAADAGRGAAPSPRGIRRRLRSAVVMKFETTVQISDHPRAGEP